MSNFKLRARYKPTGKIVSVDALDDHFGKHKYGYRIDGDHIVTEDHFNDFFEVMEPCCVCGAESELKCRECGVDYCSTHYETTVMTGNCCSGNERAYL